MHDYPSDSGYLKTLSILHYALMAGVLLFVAVAYFLLPKEGMMSNDDSLYELFRYLVPAAAIFAILGARFLGNTMLAQVKELDDPEEKLNRYRGISIVRWALMEGTALFAVVAYIVTGNTVMLLVALAAAAYMFTQRPTADLVANELGLSNEERRRL